MVARLTPSFADVWDRMPVYMQLVGTITMATMSEVKSDLSMKDAVEPVPVYMQVALEARLITSPQLAMALVPVTRRLLCLARLTRSQTGARVAQKRVRSLAVTMVLLGLLKTNPAKDTRRVTMRVAYLPSPSHAVELSRVRVVGPTLGRAKARVRVAREARKVVS